MAIDKPKLSEIPVLFLTWESPWPALGGGTLRTMGLLTELSKTHDIHLVVFSKKPLSKEQQTELTKYVSLITRVPMLNTRRIDQLWIIVNMFSQRMPYHCALLHHSFCHSPKILKKIRTFPGVVYASFGQWGTLAGKNELSLWILDQHNADVDFWRVYAYQATNYVARVAALVNYWLAQRHYSCIYANVDRIISVCKEDRQLTQVLASNTQIDVIENGVDCAYLMPDRSRRNDTPRLLFTGTSAGRNITALRQFVRHILPLIQQQVPNVELLIAGNFSQKAQIEFKPFAALRFTGCVDDMRPYFDQSDVFIAPFVETHGSKLKIAEAMAMAMPIVSTPQGIRGFALVDGESVLLASSNEHFAAQIVHLLNDHDARLRLGSMARRVALDTVDWQVLGTKLSSIVDETFHTFIK